MKSLKKIFIHPLWEWQRRRMEQQPLLLPMAKPLEFWTYFLHVWNSTFGFGTMFFIVAAVSLIAIKSSFCLSFKTCTYCEISKMRMFLRLYKMEMGRFGWQSCRAAVDWAVHKEELKLLWVGMVCEVTGKPTNFALWVLAPPGRQNEPESSVKFQMIRRWYFLELQVFIFVRTAWDNVHFSHALGERNAHRTSSSSHLWSWVSTEDWIFIFLQSALTVILQNCFVAK